jgi:hypothetical protein
MTFIANAPGVFWGARNKYANVNSARLPPVFASARSFAPFGRRQSEMQSTSENDFGCFASTGVNTLGTMFPSFGLR